MATEIKDQPRNISQKEIDLIKATFSEELLKSLRALFLGLTVSEVEKESVKNTFKNPELRAIMAKRFYPTLDRETPIGQVQDVWLGAEQMVFGNTRDTVYQALQYKELALQYTREALDLLTDPNGKRFDATYSPKSYPSDELGVILLGRNQFIRHIESQLLFLWLTTQQKEEAPEVAKKRREKDSSQ